MDSTGEKALLTYMCNMSEIREAREARAVAREIAQQPKSNEMLFYETIARDAENLPYEDRINLRGEVLELLKKYVMAGIAREKS